MYVAERMDERRHDKHGCAQFPLHAELHGHFLGFASYIMHRNAMGRKQRIIDKRLLQSYANYCDPFHDLCVGPNLVSYKRHNFRRILRSNMRFNNK